MATKPSLEDFQRWKVDLLRKYLADHGSPANYKKKAELVAVAVLMLWSRCA
jgi:hypothetical protein